MKLSEPNSLPSSLPPSGAAGGDLGNTYPNPTVVGLNGKALPANAAGALTNDGSGNLSYVAGGGSLPQLPAWTYTVSAAPGPGEFSSDNTAITPTTVLIFSPSVFGGPSGGTDNAFSTTQPGVQLVLTSATTGKSWSFIGGVGVLDGNRNWSLSNLLSTSNIGAGNWNGVYYLELIPSAQTPTQVGLGNVPNVDATNANNITSGTLPDGRFPATLPSVSGASLTGITPVQIGAATATQGATADTALQPNGNGSSLTGITAGQISGLGQQLTDDTGWTANADGGDKTSSIPSNATLDAMQAALNLVVAGFGDAFVATADKVKALETALANNLLPNA